ncbi:hypothetical protein [Paenibacillus borealis]|uniref:AMP-dependent synthetase/ligase domain-containing protein n=1 Tax=Paenibacillus borealis TaxID=160799 RepID=A0A089L846_PAEBO|nr:hypothetical protein [Paenibacillus borealis]AIQ56957.1 hypothetical protein PBOR_08455 [Paenibacillus borealis]
MILNRLDNRFLDLMRSLKSKNEYYKDKLSSLDLININPDQLYEMLPYTERMDLQELGETIYTSTNEEIIVEMTTGTTGVPLRCPKNTRERTDLAFDIWKKRLSIDREITPNNFYLLYGSNARKVYNFFDYDIQNLNNCFKYLSHIQPRWLCGSVSAFYNYAQEIDNGKLHHNIDSLRYIEFQGEYVDQEKREYIEDIFKVKSVVHYGNREMWTIAYECKHQTLHLNSNAVYIEIRNNDPDNEYGNIVTTNLQLKTLPIIKYDTEDLGCLIEVDCPCGNNSALKMIDGRISTLIKGTKLNGNIVMKGIYNRIVRKNQKIMKRFRVVQIAPNNFDVFIIRGVEFYDGLQVLIKDEFRKVMGEEVVINIFYEDRIVSNNGKMAIFSVNY